MDIRVIVVETLDEGKSPYPPVSRPHFRGAFVDSMEIVIETLDESKYPPCPLTNITEGQVHKDLKRTSENIPSLTRQTNG